MPIVAVDNRNWTAVISLLKRSCEVQEELLKLQGELMTKSGIEMHLQNQKVLFDQVENECRRIQKFTAEQTANSLRMVIVSRSMTKICCFPMRKQHLLFVRFSICVPKDMAHHRLQNSLKRRKSPHRLCMNIPTVVLFFRILM